MTSFSSLPGLIGIALVALVATAAWAQSDPNDFVSLVDDLTPIPEEAFSEPPSGMLAESEAPVANEIYIRQDSAPIIPASETSEAITVDEFENSSDDGLGFGSDFFGAGLDLLSPTEPSGRDNLLLTFGANVGYNNNVLFLPGNIVESGTASANIAAQYIIGNPRFSLRSRLDLTTTYYENRPGGNQTSTVIFLLATQYQIRPRLGLDFSTSTSYLAAPDPEVQGGTFTDNGSYSVTVTGFNLSYELLPRLSLVAGYNLNALRYDSEAINEQSGFFSQTFSTTGNWLLTPRSILLAELRYNPIDYYEAGLGSDGLILLFGLTQTVSPRFEWTLRAGAEYRTLRNPDDSLDASNEYLGPFVEGELEYQYRRGSTILGTLRYGTEPSGVSGLVIRQAFRIGLANIHQFGHRLSSRISVNYQNDAFDFPGSQGDYSQTVTSGSISLRYEFNLSMAAIITGSTYMLDSDVPNSAFHQEAVTIGLDFNL